MSLVFEQSQLVPLRSDAEGMIRVAGTRVTLDTIQKLVFWPQSATLAWL